MVSGGGPGGSTFVPIQLGTTGIVNLKVELCFVSTVFDPASPECFVDTSQVTLNNAQVDGNCDPGGGFQGMTLHIELTPASGHPSLPTGEVVSCSFNVFGSALPGFYPVSLMTTATDTQGHTSAGSASGTMTVFQQQGGECQSSSICQASLPCTDGVCCDSPSCPSGQFCNVPGSEGTCATP